MIYDEERYCYTLTKLEENCIKLHIENESLQKKLEIATKALNRMIGIPPTNFPDCETYIWEAMQALKDMEEV